jgi:hypothetical protein
MREAAGAPAPATPGVAGAQTGAAAAVSQADAAAALSIDPQAPDSAAAESEEHTLLATAVPFGPFLSAAAGFYTLFQPQLTSWYLSR